MISNAAYFGIILSTHEAYLHLYNFYINYSNYAICDLHNLEILFYIKVFLMKL
jgi:hypothetical protein